MASAPFPIPTHQTERADFQHAAFRLLHHKAHDVGRSMLVSSDDTPARDESSPSTDGPGSQLVFAGVLSITFTSP